MLRLVDVLFTIIHLGFIIFILFGWIFKSMRRVHIVFVLLTAFSWFGCGLFYGFGYCPLTDYHWQIKLRLGEEDLPFSFITYIVQRWTKLPIGDDVVNYVTLTTFLAVLLLSIYLNLIHKSRYQKKDSRG